MKLFIYKLLSVVLVVNLILIVYYLTIQNMLVVWFCVALIPVVLLFQVNLVRCDKCCCRPGLRLLVVWTLLFNFRLYFADSLLLRKCPECGSSLKQNRQGESPGAG